MAGQVLTTDLDNKQAISAAARTARDLGYAVRHLTERQFQAKRGTLALSLLLPPFTPYCDFLVSVLDDEDGDTELVLERNAPWWTGFIGVRGMKAAFEKLVQATEQAIEASGGKVLQRREF